MLPRFSLGKLIILIIREDFNLESFLESSIQAASTNLTKSSDLIFNFYTHILVFVMVDLCLNQNYLMYFENKIYNFSIYLNKHIHL